MSLDFVYRLVSCIKFSKAKFIYIFPFQHWKEEKSKSFNDTKLENQCTYRYAILCFLFEFVTYDQRRL